MPGRIRILSVIGTRPQYVKAAVVTRALRRRERVDEITVDTGQHYDREMSDFLLADLPDVRPARSLGIHGGTPTARLARLLDALGEVLAIERPDRVVVYGDTDSTLGGALAASFAGVPVDHVEAGLRSFNPAMAEERNRVLVDRLSQLRLCPTPLAVRNLEHEGVTDGVHHVGDVMYDAALLAAAWVEREPSDLLARLGVEAGGFAVATLHRAELTDHPEALAAAIGFLRDRARERPVVFPTHPRTRDALARDGISTAGLVVCPPVGYLDMARLLRAATVVYTDSGGLQKEAYFHGRPCVTLRNETEWVELVDAGWNRLWTVEQYAPRRPIPDYGEGHAADLIADLVLARAG